MTNRIKTYLLFLSSFCLILISCTADFRTDIEVFEPDVIVDDPDDPIVDEDLYDPNLTVQENLDNGVPVLEILEHVPRNDLYCLKYKGGTIYFVDPIDGSGLVVTETDIDSMGFFGCNGNEIIGADGTEIGTGWQNTLDITADCGDPENAATKCAALDLNGYDDWFLPSIQEFALMRINLYQNNCAGLGNLYVSSSEASATEMWYMSMIEGDQRTSSKDLKEFHVRASRAF